MFTLTARTLRALPSHCPVASLRTAYKYAWHCAVPYHGYKDQ